eukprot:2444456-Pleurochrysis_carterae.AAC.1
MGLSDATREREACVQRSSGATGNTRGKRVPATVSAGVLARILASVPALAPRRSPPVETYCAVSVPHPRTRLPAKLHASAEELPGHARAPCCPAPQT